MKFVEVIAVPRNTRTSATYAATASVARIPNPPTAMPAMAHPRPLLPETLMRRRAAMPSPRPTAPGIPAKNSRPTVLVTKDAIAMPSVGGAA